jgi:hypothetical protein
MIPYVLAAAGLYIVITEHMRKGTVGTLLLKGWIKWKNR